MNSVSNQQTVPYTNNVVQHTTQNPPSEHAQSNASTAADSSPPMPRPPVTAEQRGQFSSHGKLVNPKMPQAVTSGQLAELSQENKELRAKMEGMITEFGPLIQKLHEQISELTQQLNASGKATQEKPVVPKQEPESTVADDQNVAPPDTSSQPETEPDRPLTLEQLIVANDEFRRMVKHLFDQFKLVVEKLSQQVEQLTQRINMMGGPESQAATHEADTAKTVSSDEVQPDETSAPTQSEAPAPGEDSTTAMPRTAEELKQFNQQLRAGLDQMESEFKSVIAQLQGQVESLAKKVKEQQQ